MKLFSTTVAALTLSVAGIAQAQQPPNYVQYPEIQPAVNSPVVGEEAYPNFVTRSTRDRADVRRELADSRSAGQLLVGEAISYPMTTYQPSTTSRESVRNELQMYRASYHPDVPA